MTALGTFASAHLQPQRTLSQATAVAMVFMTALPLTAQEAGLRTARTSSKQPLLP
jgi:hypothetical protein